MAEQRIIFEQGGELDGDSGERGDETTEDGGVESIKPLDDGERAVQSVFNRPVENLRRRSEQLRDAGEQQLYLQDSDMRWTITGGNASGLAPTSWPGVQNWYKDGNGTDKGTFEITDTIVLQPLNTPGVDVQETVIYPFEDVSPARTAGIEFTPVATKRAYNGANLLRIKWETATAEELATAAAPGLCDVEVTGDPDHILTITILETDLTQMSNLDTALDTITAELAVLGIGFEYTVGSNQATYLKISEVEATAYTEDYTMIATAEREMHRIDPGVIADFFGVGAGYLEDGDTLTLSFADFISEVDDTGRRQRIPANSNTDVLTYAELFVSTRDAGRIPIGIPICKRIGDDIVFIDGTVVFDGQTNIVMFGQHSNTVSRLKALEDAAGAIENKIFAEPTIEEFDFGVSESELQLTATVYLGLDTDIPVNNYVRLRDRDNWQQEYYAFTSGWPLELELWDTSHVSLLTHADADANGFYENPWVHVKQRGGPESGRVFSISGDRPIAYCKKVTYSGLLTEPASAFPYAQEKDLSGDRVRVPEQPGSPDELSMGTLPAQQTEIIDHINRRPKLFTTPRNATDEDIVSANLHQAGLPDHHTWLDTNLISFPDGDIIVGVVPWIWNDPSVGRKRYVIVAKREPATLYIYDAISLSVEQTISMTSHVPAVAPAHTWWIADICSDNTNVYVAMCSMEDGEASVDDFRVVALELGDPAYPLSPPSAWPATGQEVNAGDPLHGLTPTYGVLGISVVGTHLCVMNSWTTLASLPMSLLNRSDGSIQQTGRGSSSVTGADVMWITKPILSPDGNTIYYADGMDGGEGMINPILGACTYPALQNQTAEPGQTLKGESIGDIVICDGRYLMCPSYTFKYADLERGTPIWRDFSTTNEYCLEPKQNGIQGGGMFDGRNLWTIHYVQKYSAGRLLSVLKANMSEFQSTLMSADDYQFTAVDVFYLGNPDEVNSNWNSAAPAQMVTDGEDVWILVKRDDDGGDAYGNRVYRLPHHIINA